MPSALLNINLSFYYPACYNSNMSEHLPNSEKAHIDPRKLRDYAQIQATAQASTRPRSFPRWVIARTIGSSLNKPLDLLETVIATVDLPNERVMSGDLGTIVHVYAAPHLAYEVEFVNPDGTTRALITLTPDQIRRLEPTDVITTRPLSFAA
jgi:Domain of unknown function (DUF4926)